MESNPSPSSASSSAPRKGRGLLIAGGILAAVFGVGAFAVFAAGQKDEPLVQGPALSQAYSTWRTGILSPVRASDDQWLALDRISTEERGQGPRLENAAANAVDLWRAEMGQLQQVRRPYGFSVAQGMQLDDAQAAFAALLKVRLDYAFHMKVGATHSDNPFFADELRKDEGQASSAHDAAWDKLHALDQAFGFKGE